MERQAPRGGSPSHSRRPATGILARAGSAVAAATCVLGLVLLVVLGTLPAAAGGSAQGAVTPSPSPAPDGLTIRFRPSISAQYIWYCPNGVQATVCTGPTRTMNWASFQSAGGVIQELNIPLATLASENGGTGYFNMTVMAPDVIPPGSIIGPGTGVTCLQRVGGTVVGNDSGAVANDWTGAGVFGGVQYRNYWYTACSLNAGVTSATFGGSTADPAPSPSPTPTPTPTPTPAPAPSIGNVSPTSGPSAGGTSITITGTGFLAGAGVTVGGAPCANVVVVSATQITCDVPAGSGTADVVVTNPDTQSATAAGAYTYLGGEKGARVIFVVLDRSGSVLGARVATVARYNARLAAWQSQTPDARYYLTVFDSGGPRRWVYDRLITRVRPIDPARLGGGGDTPLYDAVARQIRRLKQIDPQGPVTFAIVTDGVDTASVRWTQARLAGLIARTIMDEGWSFKYIGASLAGLEAMVATIADGGAPESAAPASGMTPAPMPSVAPSAAPPPATSPAPQG